MIVVPAVSDDSGGDASGERARLEAAERDRDLTEDEQMSLARLRIEAERASARAVLADELADRIASAERTKRTSSGG